MEGKRLGSIRASGKSGTSEAKTSVHNIGTCPIHPQQTTNHTCLSCMTVFCDACKSIHSGHDLREYTGEASDSRLIQKIFRSQVQELYEVLDNIEASKDEITTKRDAYKKSKIEVRDAVKRIVETATKLGKQAEKEIDDLEKVVDKDEQDINEHAKSADDKIARLTALRNITDADVLMPEAAETAGILYKYKKITGESGIGVKSVADVLPNIGKVDGIVDEIGEAIKVCVKTGSGTKAQYDYTKVTEIEQIALENAECYWHRICDSDMDVTSNVIMCGLGYKDIHTYDMKTGKVKQGTFSNLLLGMVKISDNQFIAAGGDYKTLYLLDENYSIKSTFGPFDTSVQSICYHSKKSFIKMSKTGESPCSVTLSHMTVDKGKLLTLKEITVKTDSEPYFIANQMHTNKVTMVSNGRLYKVDMDTSSLEAHDISQYVPGHGRIYVDINGNTLLGDNNGNLHHFDTSLHHSIIAKVSSGQILGITMRGEYMFVTAGKTLLKFKVPKLNSKNV